MKDFDIFKLLLAVLPIIISILGVYFTHKKLSYDFAKDKLEKINQLTEEIDEIGKKKKCYQQTFLETVDFFKGYNLQAAKWALEKDFNISRIKQIGILFRNDFAFLNTEKGKLILPSMSYVMVRGWISIASAIMTIIFSLVFIYLTATNKIGLNGYFGSLLLVILFEFFTLFSYDPILNYRILKKENFVEIEKNLKEFKNRLVIWRKSF